MCVCVQLTLVVMSHQFVKLLEPAEMQRCREVEEKNEKHSCESIKYSLTP